MSFARKILVLVVFINLIGASCMAGKRIDKYSQAGRALAAMEDFWVGKMSKELKEGCVANSNCDALAQYMTRVVTTAQRLSAEEGDKAIGALKNGTASVHDMETAHAVMSAYGEGVVSNDKIKTLPKEPTRSWGEMPQLFEPQFEAAINSIERTIKRIGEVRGWSEKQTAEEFNKVQIMLISVINQKDAKD